MASSPVDPEWETELERWLQPFLGCLKHKAQRRWAPVYVRGLLGPSPRKCATTLARALVPGDEEQLHHFVATSQWDWDDLSAELSRQADALVGGGGASLIVDDTAVVKKGCESVGVAHQYCGELGKQANCQALVSATLCQEDAPAPVCVGLRLYLPESWAKDQARRRKCRVPLSVRFEPKWQIALDEIDRLRASGVGWDEVQADAGYGMVAEFRAGLQGRRETWTVGVASTQGVYPVDVKVSQPALKAAPTGRPRTQPLITPRSQSAEAMIRSLGAKAWRWIAWRDGTKGKLRGRLAAARVRVADGAKLSKGRRVPGIEAWLIAEERSGGERRYYLSNRPETTTMRRLARSVKARWSCEQPHQQMKQELGLDHFEGRSWHGLHHHAVLTMISFLFLQTWRLRLSAQDKKNGIRPDGPDHRRRPVCPKCGGALSER
jgi:SRSO17 transposase